ncbi:MAG TPA: sugar phosphate isomerase/epimerase family protein [Verrucomicrobiota bacterium]|nr:sugar phosphate isomerase/epimerase [Verrucomicrobiota bacterium]HCL92094.1 xylose isomerase [Limisphaerales bacterium]HRR64177.1 sugar phosphate isomerase/epimerase family protein [Candidatus Paceibacterota bacterium]MDI9372726.1 sugar phosphate isomerase/epimerase family protein [Verrucomicrobiota bacterium]NLH84784.1 sugar phosphate isomerase/epimerase [Verrucomicrobiota bacterium]
MKRNLKKGIWYTSVPGGTVLEKFQAAKAAGFDGVEPPSHLNQEEILRARDETGVAVCSVSCGGPTRDLSHPDAAKRAEAVKSLEQAVREAKRYGAASVLVVPGAVTGQISYAETYQRVQESVRKVVPLAEELGVRLAFENVWNYFLLSPMEAARFVDEFRSPAVRWQFDVGNILNFGWPEHWIRILGPRIQTLHVKEFSRKKRDGEGLWKGFAVEYLEGDNDWPAVMKAVDEIGYTGWATLEPAWVPPDVDPVARLRQISEKLDRIIAI